MRGIWLALALVVLLGCGERSDEEELRDALATYTRELADGDFASACKRVTDPLDCITSLRAAELLAGGREELLTAWGVTDDAVDAAGRATVTVRGDHATVDNPATSDKGLEAERRDEGWKLVFPED